MDHLPVEILVHIFSFLPVADLIRVSRVNKRFSDLAGDHQFLRHLDFRQAYTCSQEDLKALLRPKGRCHMVQTLDMNAVYWFRPPFDTIARMKSLSSLHLRGIPLTFRQLHGLLTAGLPLQELSLDWPECPKKPMKMIEEMQEGVSHLKFLCLTVVTLSCVVNQFLRQCQPPLRLILYCPRLSQGFPDRSRCDMIFTFQPSAHRLLDVNAITWKDIGEEWIKKQDQQVSSLSQVTEILCYIFDSRSVMGVAAVMHACPNLKTLQLWSESRLPVDLQHICKAIPELQRLRLHMHDSDKERRKGYVLSISTLHHLTHLCLEMHLLHDRCGTEETSVTSATTRKVLTPHLKRPRLGVSSSGDAEAGLLNLIIDNCPLLTMLEIGVDDGSAVSLMMGTEYWYSLKNIKKLKRLTHLTLCNIPVTSGSFLGEIATGCPRLEFLRLANLGPTGKCFYLKELTDSVTYMASLTQLRIHQQYMAPGTALFHALKRCQNLQRLSITSVRDVLPVDLASLEQLIEAQPSLIFVGVGSVSTPKSAFTKFTRMIKKFSRPALVVLVYSDEEHRGSVPLAHKDMMDVKSWLSSSHSCSYYHQDLPFRHYSLQVKGSQTIQLQNLH